MPVVHLVAYLLKDLTLELLQPASRKIPDTQYKSLPLAANCTVISCLEPFRPPQPVGVNASIHTMSGLSNCEDLS